MSTEALQFATTAYKSDLKIRTISLQGRIAPAAGIEFLTADIADGEYSPLAVIHYSVNGIPEEYGLRIDLDKQVISDHLPDPLQERVVLEATPRLVEILDEAMAQ
jgi:hypothetical protein